jgi:molecular chaperone DnaK
VLVRPYDPAFFPFDPSLHDEDDLRRRPVGRRECGPDVEERYVVTPSGAVDVIITTPPTGLTRTFQLARHAPASL